MPTSSQSPVKHEEPKPLVDLRKYFSARCVVFYPLGPRKADYAPNLGERSPVNDEESKRITKALGRQPCRSLLSCSEVVYCEKEEVLTNRLNSLSEPIHATVNTWTQILQFLQLNEDIWQSLVQWDQTSRPLIPFGDTNRTTESFWKTHVVFPVKCIPNADNRDVVGFLLANVDTAWTFDRSGPSAAIEGFTSWIRRYIKARFRAIQDVILADPANSFVRKRVQSNLLDAALALSGGDWGCVKSLCIGKTEPGDPVLSAECVHHCPVFFEEGASPENDDVLNEAVSRRSGGIVEIGSNRAHSGFAESMHPARQMHVTFIYDSTPQGLPAIEPSLSIDQRERLVGALVLQHTHHDFLSRYSSIFHEDIRELVSESNRHLVAAIHKEILQSVSIARRLIADDQIPTIFGDLKSALKSTFQNDHFQWVLFDLRFSRHSDQAELEIEPKPFCGEVGDANQLAGIQSLLNFHHPKARYVSLFRYVLNSRSNLNVQSIHTAVHGTDEIFRITKHNDSTSARFSEYVDSERKLREESEHAAGIRRTKLLFDLGSESQFKSAFCQRQADNRVSMSLIPLVFESGWPVGLLVLWGNRALPLTDVDQNLLPRLKRVVRIFYFMRHDVRILNRLRDKALR